MTEGLVLTTELRLLAYSALVCLVLWIPYILSTIQVRGLAKAVSYPSGGVDDLPAWAQRSHRAHMNLVENLAPFAVFVLVAHVIGVSNGATVLGAQLFFWARIVQIADDAHDRALGDGDADRELTHRDVRILGDAQEDVRVIGQEVPRAITARFRRETRPPRGHGRATRPAGPGERDRGARLPLARLHRQASCRARPRRWIQRQERSRRG